MLSLLLKSSFKKNVDFKNLEIDEDAY